MNKEEFINKIKDLKINVPDEYFFLEYNKIIYDILNEKENLIKYLENKINDIKMNYSQINGNYFNMNYKIEAYQDILEKVKSGKYD